MKTALEWFAWNANNGVTPPNNTAMNWDEIQGGFKTEKTFIYHQGVWATKEWMLGDAKGATWPTDEAGYFHKIGWIHAPAAAKGGQPANLSHPIVYVVNPKSANASLAAMLVAYATLPYYNVQHAVGGVNGRRGRHRSYDERLGNRLARTGRQGPVVVRLGPEFGCNELLARHPRNRVNHALVTNRRSQRGDQPFSPRFEVVAPRFVKFHASRIRLRSLPTIWSR
jgi:hypothetical protein